MFSLSFILAACGGGASEEEAGGEAEGEDESNIDEDGVLNYAVDQAPEGMFIDGFAGSAIDSEIISFLHDDLITVNEEMEYEPYIADWETDDNQVYTFTIEEGVKWHNGDELKMEDWKFAIEVIAGPDYEEPRCNNDEGIRRATDDRRGGR